MQSWRRIFYFLLLNVAVSALTTWTVVTLFINLPASGPESLPPSAPANGGGELLLVTQPVGGQDGPAAVEITPDLLSIESIIGTGELDTERVLIQHIGQKEISLTGWQLRDEDGNAYNFPALTMFQGGAVTVYSRSGTSTVVELYWGQDSPVWQPGEQAFLIDPQGEIRAVYTVP
jgi:hypothetical protein